MAAVCVQYNGGGWLDENHHRTAPVFSRWGQKLARQTYNILLLPDIGTFCTSREDIQEQVRLISVKAERPNHPSRYHARQGAGSPPWRRRRDSMRLSRLRRARPKKMPRKFFFPNGNGRVKLFRHLPLKTISKLNASVSLFSVKWFIAIRRHNSRTDTPVKQNKAVHDVRWAWNMVQCNKRPTTQNMKFRVRYFWLDRNWPNKFWHSITGGGRMISRASKISDLNSE